MGISTFTLVGTLLACAIIGFQETGTPFGLVFPTATAIGLVAVTVPTEMLVFVWASIVLGAVVGDCVAVSLGRRVPDRIATILSRRSPRLAAGIARHGAAILLLTRFVPVVRTLAPSALGCLGAPTLRNVVLFSAAGASLWSAALVGGGKVVTDLLLVAGFNPADVVRCMLGLAAMGLLVAAGTHTRRQWCVRRSQPSDNVEIS